MTLKTSSKFEYYRLLQRVNDLPSKEGRVTEFWGQLNKFYEECHAMLVELVAVIKNFRDIAGKINERQPLVKRKEPQTIL